jgi:hypothetical protein
MVMFIHCTRGEMDIIPVFGTVVPGSSPGGCTVKREKIEIKASFFL